MSCEWGEYIVHDGMGGRLGGAHGDEEERDEESSEPQTNEGAERETMLEA